MPPRILNLSIIISARALRTGSPTKNCATSKRNYGPQRAAQSIEHGILNLDLATFGQKLRKLRSNTC